LQLWQGLSEAQGRGYGDREVAIMFTDLIDFSQWALEAGDSLALELLRRVDELVSAAIYAHEGSVVKRMGDGLMAVFEQPRQAVAAGHEAQRQLAGLKRHGDRARLRVGIHVGRPRKLGGDYYGVDVNVAARVMAAADAGEVLVSGVAGARLGESETRLRARGRLEAKGAPQDLEVYLAEPGS
jgi:class 3 adenylate cyclase